MKLRHRIAHLFGWNYGSVVSWWQDEGDKYVAYIGFQCSACGEVTGERMRGNITKPRARLYSVQREGGGNG
jgi:hypothetical protein